MRLYSSLRSISIQPCSLSSLSSLGLNEKQYNSSYFTARKSRISLIKLSQSQNQITPKQLYLGWSTQRGQPCSSPLWSFQKHPISMGRDAHLLPAATQRPYDNWTWLCRRYFHFINKAFSILRFFILMPLKADISSRPHEIWSININ